MATRIAALAAISSTIAFATLIASPALPGGAQETTVAVGDTWFCDAAQQGNVCQTSIPERGTVIWDFGGASLAHTVTDCGANCDSPTPSPEFDSGQMTGGTFQHTFDTAGTFLYHCEVHPTLMLGAIHVLGQDTPGPSVTAVVDQSPVAITLTPSPTSGNLPSTGYGGDGDGGLAGWAIVGAGAAGVAFGLAGAALYLRGRRSKLSA